MYYKRERPRITMSTFNNETFNKPCEIADSVNYIITDCWRDLYKDIHQERGDNILIDFEGEYDAFHDKAKKAIISLKDIKHLPNNIKAFFGIKNDTLIFHIIDADNDSWIIHPISARVKENEIKSNRILRVKDITGEWMVFKDIKDTDLVIHNSDNELTINTKNGMRCIRYSQFELSTEKKLVYTLLPIE